MLTVHVYNYAGVSRGELSNAEREAARIIGGAGVETIWFDCTAPSLAPLRTQGGPRTDCSWNPANGAHAILRILNRSDYNRTTLNGEIFGYANSPLLAAVLFAHSRTGIMCGDWGLAQLRRGLMGGLRFTPNQSARIRAAIEAKTKPSGAPHVDADADRARSPDHIVSV